MDQTIKFVKQTRKEWLKNCPQVIYDLVYGYEFYYPTKSYLGYATIHTDIIDFIEDNYDKKRHSIRLYKKEGSYQWYLVVFAKKEVRIYYTNEYTKDESWSNIKRFIKKFITYAENAKKARMTQNVLDAFEQ